MEGVSCIIPCYNEVSRIRNVLEAVKSNSKINEIIVVDDASEDGSSEVIRQFDGVVYVRLEKNRGKSASVYEGFKISKYDVILLLDADIKNITAEDITKMLMPVLDGGVSVVIGAVKNTIRIFGTDILSGQRAIKREILKDLGDFSKFRYGLEVRLNKYILDNDVMFKTVSLKRVQNKFKMEKIGFVPGLFLDIKMMHEIFKSIGKREYVRQAIFMPVKNKRIKDMLRVR